jgi:hypothetical protein
MTQLFPIASGRKRTCGLARHGRLCYTHHMSDTLTVRVPGREKDVWQKVAKRVGEDLSEFARKAVRQRVQAVQAKHGSPWDDLLGSVSTDAPPATNVAVRRAMRSKES